MAAKLRVLDNGTLRTIIRLRIKQAGVLRDIRTLKVMDGGVLRTVGAFADALSATMSPASVTGFGEPASISAPASVTTSTASLVKGGGFSPYTYAWTHISGDTATINSPSSASTTFTAIVTLAEGELQGVFRCTVTDALGATASDTVTATFIRNEF